MNTELGKLCREEGNTQETFEPLATFILPLVILHNEISLKEEKAVAFKRDKLIRNVQGVKAGG